MDIVKNSNHNFMAQNISMVINRMQPLVVGVLGHIKVHYQFYKLTRNLIP